jgi:hypothetical protein
MVADFVQRLSELGWIEGRTIAIEYRWSEGRRERLPEIELAKAGERNADRLCEYALAKVREADGNTSQLYQSSSASRATATEAGLLDLNQSADRPLR